MVWLVVDKDGTECVFSRRPIRGDDGEVWVSYNNDYIELPKGSIKKLIGRELTWEDEPVEIK